MTAALNGVRSSRRSSDDQLLGDVIEAGDAAAAGAAFSVGLAIAVVGCLRRL